MATTHAIRSRGAALVPRASLADTAKIMSRVIITTVAKGPIIRRPRVVNISERLDLDGAAVRTMQRIRNKYGQGPLMLRLPAWHQAVILSPEHLRRVLNNSPEPFATASFEKRKALGHFEPKGALVSHGPDRTDRRRFNEAVLEHQNAMHSMARSFVEVVEKEARHLMAMVPPGAVLTWDTFAQTWFRIVRQVCFGPGARDDTELREMLDTLRSKANWSFLHPGNRKLRDRLHARLREYIGRAEPGSLAAVMAQVPKTPRTAPEQQVPQWLFAWDPAGMTVFRALALLAAHPEHADRAREEARTLDTSAQPLPFLRAAMLEALRLWPTTPMVLRQTTEETHWETGVMPARTGVLIFAPFFHRDDERIAFAHRFAPEVWTEQGGRRDWPLIPFSDGPAVCPGRFLVQLVGSAMLAELLRDRRVRLTEPERLDPKRPMPSIVSNYTLKFEFPD